jgi:hypothetical protein
MNLTTPGVVTTSAELATVTVGTVTTSSTLLARVALTQPGSMHREGGGMGVSDLLELRTFSSSGPTPAPVGFQVSFQSDGEMGITNPGGLTAVIVETGLEQLLLSGTFPLPVVGSVNLTVTGRSDLDPVPEPVTLLLFGTTMVGLGLGARWRRRRQD